MYAWVLRVVAVLSLLAAGTLAAQPVPPEVQSGLVWLQSQVQPDGALTSEATSIAIAEQSREEALLTIAALNASSPALANRIASTSVDITESIARQLLAAAAVGGGVSANAARLSALQNADGGYGADAGFGSGPIDTAFALLALSAAHTTDTAAATRALAYLGAARASGGGWGLGDQSNAYTTAYVLLAAAAWQDQPGAAGIRTDAASWLLAHRGAGQSLGATMDDALGLMALQRTTNDGAVLTPFGDALRAAQAGDGSWAQDPYLTALATRALWFLAKGPPPPTTGGAEGTVVDDRNGAAIVGATVQLVESGSIATSTGANGRFVLAGVAPGNYTLRVAKLGFEILDSPVAIVAGQSALLGTLRLRVATLTASLGGQPRDESGVPLPGVTLRVGALAATTNIGGLYTIAGIAPGSITVAATSPGYQSVSATFTVDAGRGYLFSPTLYSSGSPPATAAISGTVVDTITHSPIAAVSVTLGGATVTTAADGRFAFANQVMGVFTLAFSASGYYSGAVSGYAAPGPNELGGILLSALPSSSTLSGIVTDASTSVPIVGALLAVQGQSLNATTGTDGRYSIAGISGVQFTLAVSATGYATRSIPVNLPQPGLVTLDIQLATSSAAGISFDEVETDKPSYLPNDEIELDFDLRNATTSDAELTVSADVIDPNGNVAFVFRANPQVVATELINAPLIFGAGTLTALDRDWQADRRPAGAYQVIARALDRDGRVVAQGSTTFAVVSAAAYLGHVEADPPVVQAGIGQPVHITGRMFNVGNLPLPAANAHVDVILANPDTNVTYPFATSATTLLTGAPLDRPQTLAMDASGNLYTLNDVRVVKIDPQGSATVVISLVGPQPVGLALAPDGTIWVYCTSNQMYHVTAPGVATLITLSKVDRQTGLGIRSDNTLIISGNKGVEQRLVARSPAGVETVLMTSGVSSPYGGTSAPNGDLIVANYGDDTLSRVTPQGVISAFATGLDRPASVARGPDGNYYVGNLGDNTISKVTPAGVVSTFATGLNNPQEIAFDSTGRMFVSNRGDASILRFQLDGSRIVFSRGLGNQPQGMRYDAAGNLYVANLADGTVRKKTPQNAVVDVAVGLSQPRGLGMAADGTIYVANEGNGTLTRITSQAQSTLVTGLSMPWGVAVDGAGKIWVAERGRNQISAFNPDGTPSSAFRSVLVQPADVRIDKDEKIYFRNTDSITIVEAGVARLFAPSFVPTSIAVDPVNGGLVALKNAQLWRIDTAGTAVKLIDLPITPPDLAVRANGEILIRENGVNQLRRLDQTGNQIGTIALPMSASRLVATGEGRIYVRLGGSGANFAEVNADDSLRQFSSALPDAIFDLGMGRDGNVVVVSGNNRVLSVDSTTGAFTQISNGLSIYSASRDALGRVVGLSSAPLRALLVADASNTIAYRVDGFNNPYDILWTGTDFRFVDSQQQLFSLTPTGTLTWLTRFETQYLAKTTDGIWGGASNFVTKYDEGTSTVTNYVIPNNPTTLATAPNDTLTVGTAQNSILVLDANRVVLAEYPALAGCNGLAVDAFDRLYVALYDSERVARFDVGSTLAKTFAMPRQPRRLAFAPDGTLWISSGYRGVLHADANGVVSGDQEIGLHGMVLVNGEHYGFDGISQVLRKSPSGLWQSFAAGLSGGVASVRVTPSDEVLIAVGGTGTVSRYENQTLTTILTGVTALTDVDRGSDGALYVTARGGMIARQDPSGVIVDLRARSALQNKDPLALVARDPDHFYVMGYNFGHIPPEGIPSIFKIATTQQNPPPAAGTVVFNADRPIGALPVAPDQSPLDFGSWTPQYAGEYRVELSRPDLPGLQKNFLHVGPLAQAELTALQATQPPGDQSESMCLSLSGADFTTVSRADTSRFRQVAISTRPLGLGADRAGNILYTTESSLIRVDPQGNATIMASGLTTYNGLGVDSAENIYFPSINSGNNHYQLMRVTPAGQLSIFADLGFSYIAGGAYPAGVGVNSKDEIFVGTTNKLIKITPQGQVSLLTTQGVPLPYGISIDGYDTIYVQNRGNVIAKIDPDGTVATLYSGDPTYEPSFEYEGVTLTTDCADNLYLAPTGWNLAGVSGEEHRMIQVISRTGEIATVIDTALADNSLYDIDVIAYDRFGRRLLMFNDTFQSPLIPASIWQLPVGCGSIDVRAGILTRPGQTLTATTRTPFAVIPRADGRTEYSWNLRDLDVNGERICFDSVLTGLALGELRPVVDAGYLAFQNTFVPGEILVPIEIPSVQVTNLIGITAGTDHAEYHANETAALSARLTNPGLAPVAGALVLEVTDADGVLVRGALSQPVNVLAQDALDLGTPFAIGSLIPGTYRVVVRVTQGPTEIARGSASFVVLPDDSVGSATSSLSVDKQSYRPSDRVQINSRARDISANIILNDLTLAVRVSDPSGVQVLSVGYSIAQLQPGALRDFSTVQTLVNADAGTYKVTQDLTDAANHLYDHREVTYVVTTTADTGAGLSGTIGVAPNLVNNGGNVVVTAMLSNGGNSDVSGLPVRMTIIDVENAAVLANWPSTVSLARTASQPLSANWVSCGTPSGTYFAALIATVGGNDLALAQAPLTVVAPTADVSISITDGLDSVGASLPVAYTIVVSNAGPQPVAGAVVTSTPPQSLGGVGWTCSGSGGAVCPRGAGTNSINESVDLPAGGSLTYTLNATTPAVVDGLLSVTASVSMPLGCTLDPDSADRTATDVDFPPGLFRDGFESAPGLIPEAGT